MPQTSGPAGKVDAAQDGTGRQPHTEMLAFQPTDTGCSWKGMSLQNTILVHEYVQTGKTLRALSSYPTPCRFIVEQNPKGKTIQNPSR